MLFIFIYCGHAYKPVEKWENTSIIIKDITWYAVFYICCYFKTMTYKVFMFYLFGFGRGGGIGRGPQEEKSLNMSGIEGCKVTACRRFAKC